VGVDAALAVVRLRPVRHRQVERVRQVPEHRAAVRLRRDSPAADAAVAATVSSTRRSPAR